MGRVASTGNERAVVRGLGGKGVRGSSILDKETCLSFCVVWEIGEGR